MTPHFPDHELGIRAGTTPAQAAAIQAVAEHVLEPFRATLPAFPSGTARWISVTSGLDPAHARLAGAAKQSQHIRGEAADCIVPDDLGGYWSSRDVARAFLQAGIPFDQLIWYDEDDHIHISYIADGGRRPNRGQVLRCTSKVGEKYREERP